MARALTYFLMSSRSLALTHNGEKAIGTPPAQAEALRVQVALALNAEPKFRAKSDPQKQEIYETLMITAAYAETVYGTGIQQKDAKIQELGRALARDNFKRVLGVAPEKARLTATGLEF